MIIVTIKDRAMKRGISNAHQLGLALGVTPNVSARLWSGDFKMLGIDTTLNRLCEVLECQPNALFKYVSDKGKD